MTGVDILDSVPLYAHKSGRVFHTDNHFLAAYREANKVTDTETVLDQLAMTAPEHTFSRSFASTCKIIELPLYSSRVHLWLYKPHA